MKLLICGSRKLRNEETYQRLENFLNGMKNISLILHGGAKGVDQMAGRYAKENNLESKIIRPDYERWPYKLAPLKRNEELVKRCTHVVAVYAPGQVRKGGTWYTVQKAVAVGKEVTELFPAGEIRTLRSGTLFNER